MAAELVTIDLGPAGEHSVSPAFWDLIVRESRARRLDPFAVIAVWLGEGGIRPGGRGDYQGGRPTSFGPAQLHEGGALPSRFDGNPAAAGAFADSPAGIRYALDGIAKVAAGLTGGAAIDAIVRKFEKPARPDTSIANATERYRRLSTVQLPATGDGTTPVGLPIPTFPYPGGSLPSNPEAPGVVGEWVGDKLLTGVAYAGLTLAGLTLMVLGLLRALGTSPLELARGRAATRAYNAKLDDEIPF